MSNGVDFETYLISKKIDSAAFRKAEPEVWNAWKNEFEQVHPNSFTVQKLNLINPIRRKYLLQESQEKKATESTPSIPVPPPAPRPGKPVMKPRPKMGPG
jgi:Fe-S cluster biosynthesis and repair protein YggX